MICGCMFSGKTEELLRRARAVDPDRVILFKHSRDDRYSATEVVTHRQDSHCAVTVSDSHQIPARVSPRTEFVGIDEGHFFAPSLVEVCRELACCGCTVAVTALDLDSWGQPFASIVRLREQADTVIVKHAICARCGQPADHTQRTTPIVDGNIVGGPEAFEPRCLNCWTPPPEEPQ